MSTPVGTTDLDFQSSDLVGIGLQLGDTDTFEVSHVSNVCSDHSSLATLLFEGFSDCVMPVFLSVSGLSSQSVVLRLFPRFPASPVVESPGVEGHASVLLVAMDTGQFTKMRVASLVTAMVVSLATRDASLGSACLQASTPVSDVSSVEHFVFGSTLCLAPTLSRCGEVSDGLSLDRKLFPRYVGSVGCVGKSSVRLALRCVVVFGADRSG